MGDRSITPLSHSLHRRIKVGTGPKGGQARKPKMSVQYPNPGDAEAVAASITSQRTLKGLSRQPGSYWMITNSASNLKPNILKA